eukprot:Phypoly_transcript_01159.p1 GENE.Phypoly_transcript_01159~~Phypoly_transcript_01159.p1  ORF type:complete len:1003 (+),score=175.51 Phypoly_transcript_01159:241-3249(+)
MVPITCYARALDMVDALLLILERRSGDGCGRVEFMNRALQKYLGIEESSAAINNDTVINLHANNNTSLSGNITLRDKLGNDIVFGITGESDQIGWDVYKLTPKGPKTHHLDTPNRNEAQLVNETFQSLQKSFTDLERRFQSVVANAHDKILFIDSDGKVLFAMEDGDSSTLLGTNLVDWLAPVTGLMKPNIDFVFSSKSSANFEAKHTTKDTWFNVTMAFYNDQSAVVTLSNITEIKQLSTELLNAMNAKNRFLANMSHEIRTPISGILGMARLMEETGLTPDQTECISTIRSCGESLLSVIDDIMDYTKLESSELVLQKVEMSLTNCFEEAIYIALPAIENKGLEVVLNIAPNIPARVIADPSRVRQVVLNLLNNSVKFTEKGFILVTITGQAAPDSKTEWMFSVSVKDTGCGVPIASQDKLFQLFSQLDMSATKRFGGTGVGLALVKRLVTLMGGSVWMESTGVEGEGSTFSFSFKAQVIPSVPAEIVFKSVRDFSPSTQVIIIDKSEIFRENLRERLKQKGFSNICTFAAFDAAQLKEFVDDTLTTKTLMFCELDEIHNQNVLELQSKTAPAFTCVLMGKLRPQEGIKENYFIRKPIKEESLKNLILELTNLWLSKSTKRRHSVSDIPSSRFIRPATRQPSLPILEEEPAPLKILVAEDNLMNQKVMMRSLNVLGHTDVQIAKDGKQTMEALENGIPDLILMDIQMPIYDGVTCTKMIREKYGPWPFIASMTANTFPEDKANCLNAGMNAFLTKPLRIDQVRQVVQECQLAKRNMFPPRVRSLQRPIARTRSDHVFKNPLKKAMHSSPVQKSRSYDVLKNPFHLNANHDNNNENNNNNNNNTSNNNDNKNTNKIHTIHLDNTHVLRNSMDFYKRRTVKPINLDSYKMTTQPPSPPSAHTSESDESECDLNASSESIENTETNDNNESTETNDNNETHDNNETDDNNETEDNNETDDNNETIDNDETNDDTNDKDETNNNDNTSNESFDRPDNPLDITSI